MHLLRKFIIIKGPIPSNRIPLAHHSFVDKTNRRLDKALDHFYFSIMFH